MSFISDANVLALHRLLWNHQVRRFLSFLSLYVSLSMSFISEANVIAQHMFFLTIRFVALLSVSLSICLSLTINHSLSLNLYRLLAFPLHVLHK